MKSKSIISKVSKWGNGYAIRIPVNTLNIYRLVEGSEVVVSSEEKGFSIVPKRASLESLSLKEIMNGVLPSMVSSDIADTAFGKPQGKEIW
jgi:antitoxin component of MazEF toxin-antitoxin module